MDNTPVIENTAEPGQAVKIVVETAPQTPTTPKETIQLIPQDNWQTSPLFHEVANFLNIGPNEYEDAANQLSVITDWAIEHAGSNKASDIMHTIRDLEDKLQPPPWDEKRHAYIYRFLQMESQYNDKRKTLGAYAKSGKWD